MRTLAVVALVWALAAARAEVYLPGPEDDARASSLSKDPPVSLPEIKKHDLVMIRVKDVFQFKNNITSNAKEEYDIDFELADWFNIKGNGLDLRAQPGRRVDSRSRDEGTPLKIDLESEKEAKGAYTQSDQKQLTVSITAEVADVRPNGTLVLEARKVTEKGEDRQIILFTGVVRREDVGADNVIEYERIANPVLKIQEEGPSSDATSRGWLARAIDVIWPF